MTIEPSDLLKCHTDWLCSSVASEAASQVFQVPLGLVGASGWEVQERQGLSNFMPLTEDKEILGALQVPL